MVLPSTTLPDTSNGEMPLSITNDMIKFPFQTNHSNIIITELPADIPDGMIKINHSNSPRLPPKDKNLSGSSQNLTVPSHDHIIPERKSSLNSKATNSPVLTPGKLKEIASAPSTLTKAKTEAKGGEVYV